MMQLGATMQSGATEEVLFRAGDIVSVRSVTGEMWVAQLKQPIIMQSPSAAPNGTRLSTFASARVAVATLCRRLHSLLLGWSTLLHIGRACMGR
jgi:hypothetical protein